MLLLRTSARITVVGRATTWLQVTATVALLTSTVAAAQGEAEKHSPRNPAIQEASASKNEEKLTLAEATRVSTAEAARGAAAEETKKRVRGKAPRESTGGNVLEFRPVPQTADASSSAVVPSSKDSKKSALKNVHGSVSGSLDPKNSSNRSTAGSVGVGSKSGKSHIHVETDRSRTTLSSSD